MNLLLTIHKRSFNKNICDRSRMRFLIIRRNCLLPNESEKLFPPKWIRRNCLLPDDSKELFASKQSVHKTAIKMTLNVRERHFIKHICPLKHGTRFKQRLVIQRFEGWIIIWCIVFIILDGRIKQLPLDVFLHPWNCATYSPEPAAEFTWRIPVFIQYSDNLRSRKTFWFHNIGV